MASRINFTPPRRNFGWLHLLSFIGSHFIPGFIILWSIAVVFLVGLLSSEALSQVKIRERIQINPKPTASFELAELPETPMVPVTSSIIVHINGGLYNIIINGCRYGSMVPVDRFSQLLNPFATYDFGKVGPGTEITGTVGALISCVQGYPDVDLIQEPRTFAVLPLNCCGNIDWDGHAYQYCFGDPSSDFSGYVILKIQGHLDHFKCSFDKDHIDIGEETVLHLMPMSDDGGSIEIHDSVSVCVMPDGYIRCEDADYEDWWNNQYYYLWSKARNGIKITGTPVRWDGSYHQNSILVGCAFAQSNTSVPIWVRTYISQFGLRTVPATVDYSKTARIYLDAENWYGMPVTPQRPVDLVIQIGDTLEGPITEGSRRNINSIKMRTPTTQSITDSIFPMGYFISPAGEKTDRLYPTYEFAHDSGIVYVAQGDSLKRQSLVKVPVTAWDRLTPTLGWGEVWVNNGSEILLGATKYYYATEENGELKIHETTDPTHNLGLSDVKFYDPVAGDGSEKNPVYWEDQYPIYSGNVFTGSEKLPSGMIRLVGRYWEDGKKYKAILSARDTTDNKGASIEIEVKKPSVLGDTSLTDKQRHTFIIDVKGDTLWLDELIIKYAGKYGIPPQFIKGDVQKESYDFNPSYRWEPFYDAWYIQNNSGGKAVSIYFADDFQYKIKSFSDEGNPEIPTDHTNLFDGAGRISGYPGFVGTIWEEFNKYCSVVNPSASKNLYPKYSQNGDTLWYTYPAKMWDTKFQNTSKALLKNENITNEQRETAALDTANNWLRYQWQAGIMNSGIAQTRTASSYGLLQMMYPTAHEERNYPIDDSHYPELLNNTDTNFCYAIPYLGMKLDTELVYTPDKTNNWAKGFELTFIRAFNRYNSAKKETAINNRQYGYTVLKYSRNYLPKMQKYY